MKNGRVRGVDPFRPRLYQKGIEGSRANLQMSTLADVPGLADILRVMDVDLFLSGATHWPHQAMSSHLVALVRRGTSLKDACQKLGTNASTWYRRRASGESPEGFKATQYFTLRLAAAEVGAARTRLQNLAETLQVEVADFPELMELQDPMVDREQG